MDDGKRYRDFSLCYRRNCASHEYCFFLKLILSQLVSLNPYSSLLNSILWQNLLLQLFLQHIMFVICVIYSLWYSSNFFSTLSRLVWNFEIQHLQTCCHDLNFTEANIWDKAICIKLHLYCIPRLVYMGFSRYMRNFALFFYFSLLNFTELSKIINVIGIHMSVQHQLRIIHQAFCDPEPVWGLSKGNRSLTLYP